MVEVGKTYYFVIHAYHHVIATVREITGKREAVVDNVLWIYNCRRNWTDFFRDGMCQDTNYHRFPNASITWMAAFEWPHSTKEYLNGPRRGG